MVTIERETQLILDQIEQEARGPVRIMSRLQRTASLIGLGFGVMIIASEFFSFVGDAVGVPIAYPEVFSSWFIQALILIVLSYVTFRGGWTILELEPGAFSSLLYLNLITAIVYVTIGVLAIPLILLSVLLAGLPFVRSVRPVWYNEFREDMRPRAKEFRFSLHLIRKSPLVLAGIVIIVFMVSVALLAPFITTYGPEERVWYDLRKYPGEPSTATEYLPTVLVDLQGQDIDLLPILYLAEFSVVNDSGELHLTTTDDPVVDYDIALASTGSDNVNVSIYGAVYDVDLSTFESMDTTERNAHMVGIEAGLNALYDRIELSNVTGVYVAAVWFDAPSKTSAWSVEGTAQYKYAIWRAPHIWGTDRFGGDIYSRVIWAAQVDLRIAFQIVIVALTSGALIGAAAGYFGGKIDEIVMRITDIFFAFPGLILAMAIVMAIGVRNLDTISIALMIVWWPGYARLVRGQVLAEREKLYVEAALSVGASDTRILLFHILPNTVQPLIVAATMDFGSVLLTAAGLAFIGFGPPAGAAEWGLMISDGQEYLLSHPHMATFPGLAILVSALAFNLAGDGIRDIMDPKLRRR